MVISRYESSLKDGFHFIHGGMIPDKREPQSCMLPNSFFKIEAFLQELGLLVVIVEGLISFHSLGDDPFINGNPNFVCFTNSLFRYLLKIFTAVRERLDFISFMGDKLLINRNPKVFYI